MSVAAVGSSKVSEIKTPEVSRPKPIKIDFEAFPKEFAGLKLTNVIVCDYGREKDRSPVEIEVLRKDVDITKSQFVGEPRILLSFKTAIEYMVDLINEQQAMTGDNEVRIPIPPKSTIHNEIYFALGNYKTMRPDLLSNPPRYDGKTASATPGDLNYLHGAIFHLLYEQGLIAGYGRIGPEFWVRVNS